MHHIGIPSPGSSPGLPEASHVCLVVVRSNQVVEGFPVFMCAATRGGHREGVTPGDVRTIEPFLLSTRTAGASESARESRLPDRIIQCASSVAKFIHQTVKVSRHFMSAHFLRALALSTGH